MKKIVFLLFVITLVGCGKIPETRYFTLTYDLEQNTKNENSGILFVKNFKSDPIYNNNKMIYKVDEYEIKFDNYRRWVLAPGDLVTIQTVEHLRHTGLFSWVTNTAPRMSDYWVLDGRVVNFEENVQENQDKRFVNVGIVFTLFRSNSDTIYLNQTITKSVDITQPDVEGIVSAMSQATREVLETLSDQISELESF